MVRLKEDYWHYVVFNCATNPKFHPNQDPVRLGWDAVVTVKHYKVGTEVILSVDKASSRGGVGTSNP